MNNNRAISNIRMIATCMVVILHILQQLEKINSNIHIVTDWFNLGLVMFFSISAFLYSNRTIQNGREWILHRYKEICIPSIITVILTILVYSSIFAYPGNSIVIYSLFTGGGLECFVPNSWMFIQYWFLTYILFCYITVLFIQKIDVVNVTEKKFWLALLLASLILQIIGTIIKRKFGIPVLSWGILLRFYLVYFIFRKYTNALVLKKVFSRLTILLIPLLIGTFYVRYAIKCDGILRAGSELLFIYVQTLAGSILFYYLYQYFTKHSMPDKWLNISDRYSYPIYSTHCLFIGYSTSLIFKFDNVFAGIMVSLLCTGLASVVLYEATATVKSIITK